ncbi:hypothetical protein ACJ41O_003810 [Fusarium nematophilum]
MAHFLAHPTIMEGSHIQYGFIGGLSISQALFISPIIPSIRRTIGTRWTLLIGTALVSISLFTSSFTTQVWHLFLSQGFCFGWGMGLTYITAMSVLPSWFSGHRSLAVGFSTSGAGIGGLLYSLATNALIESVGIRWTYRVLALCALVANLSSSFLLKELGGRAEVEPELRFDPRDFKRYEVMLIIFWGFVTDLGYIILLYSLPSYAASIGLTSTQGSIANALLGLGLALGRPLIGYFSDTLGRINIAGCMTLLCAICCFALWIPAKSFVPLLLFALPAGAFCGTFWSTVTPVVAEVVGVQKLASIFSVICLSLALPTTFADAIAKAMLKDESQHVFLSVQVFVGFTFLTGALSLWLLRGFRVSYVEAERQGSSATHLRPNWQQELWGVGRFLFTRGRF